MVKVLVLMATYNGEKYIKEQIDSVLAQDDVEVTIRISDDGSTDDTLKIIDNYLPLKNVTFTQNRPGTGSAASNFLGMIKNTEDYMYFDFFAFADQDDVWLQEKLHKAVMTLKNQNADFYFSNLIKWNSLKDEKSILKKSFQLKKYDYLFEGGSAGCTYVFNVRFFEAIKQNFSKLDLSGWNSFSHDWYIYFLARINNYKVAVDNNAYILYRIHDSNVHGQMNAFTWNAVKKRLALVREGWYYQHINGYKQLLLVGSNEYKIYKMYSKNIFSRIRILLKYNFQLMRDPKKFMMFAAVSLITKNRKDV